MNREKRNEVRSRPIPAYFAVQVVLFDKDKPVGGRIIKGRDFDCLINTQNIAESWGRSRAHRLGILNEKKLTYKTETTLFLPKH